MKASHLWGYSLVAAGLFSCAANIPAKPRPPLPPLPEFAPMLSQSSFDEAYWERVRNRETLPSADGDWIESWSGYSLRRSGVGFTSYLLPALESSGHTNLMGDRGAIRFWFKPYWNSAAITKGTGPGAEARLLEWIVEGNNKAAISWALSINADGSKVSLREDLGGDGKLLLEADLAWKADQWHCLALNYGPKETSLLIDGVLVSTGSGVASVSPAAAGLIVGSTLLGANAAEGEFDELCTFARPLQEAEIDLHYQFLQPTAALGPISKEEETARLENAARYRAEREGTSAQRFSAFSMLSSSNCVTNVPVYLTNITCTLTTNEGSLVTFDIMGGTNGLLYDLFTTTNLLGTNITNSAWTWLVQGPTCNTYTFTNEPQAFAFYVLGTPIDSDADGLTDAYELLVSKTDPNDSDTDNDGMPDGWEVHHGLNPFVNDASDDPDGDDLTNLQEYNSGTNSTNPHDVMVVAWGDNTAGQCNMPPGLRDVVAVAGGSDFSVALRRDGTVVAWGANSQGQTNVATEATNCVAIAAGFRHALALKGNGTVVQWGYNWASVPTNLTDAMAVSVGYQHSLALRSNGTVVAWGNPAATNEANWVPTNLVGVKAIASGWNHNLALLSNGTVTAWGLNGAELDWHLLEMPTNLNNVISIAAGGLHSVAVRGDGTAVAWGYNLDGQTNVPAGLSNLVAVSAGTSHSLALKADGTVGAWGNFGATPIFQPAFVQNGVAGIVAIASGSNHGLAIRTGRLKPIIVEEPVRQASVTGGTVSFTNRAVGLAGITYQWQFNGVNLSGATNATLTLTNVQAAQEGTYRVVAANGAGATTNAGATFTLITPPVIVAATQPSRLWIPFSDPKGGESFDGEFRPHPDNFTLNVTASAPAEWASPLQYQWRFNGTSINNANSTNFTAGAGALRPTDGEFSVVVTNAAGGITNFWQVRVAFPGNVVTWGPTNSGQIERPVTLTNVIAAAVGESNSVAVNHDGHVTQWGLEWAPVPTDLTNAVAVSAGYQHNLALRNNGKVVAWGYATGEANWVPTNLAAVKGIAAGWNHNVAVLSNGTVTAWGTNGANLGWHLTEVPPGLTNVMAVAAGSLHSLALRSNGTVVAWGYNSDGQTNAPNLSNVVAIAGGGAHSLALQSDGKVVAWGSNSSGQTNVPAGLSNVMAIAAGFAHSVALKNDGTVVAWGRNTEGQTNVPSGVVQAQGIAAGGNHSLATIFSHTVSYPVDISRDLVLIYNTNSADSLNVFNYYVQHRPFASNAIVLPIGCTNGEFMTTNQFVTQLLVPWLDWLKLRPTTRPRYVVLFLDIPSRMPDRDISGTLGKVRGSVSFAIRDFTPGIKPYVTHIHMGDTNACKAYIDKLEFFGTNYSPGQVILSASAGGYGNGDYYFDNAVASHSGNGRFEFTNALHAVLAAGVASNLVHFNHATNDPISSLSNVVGYLSNGNYAYPSTATNKQDYAIDGRITFTGNSQWYVISTFESFNGQRVHPPYQWQQGKFIDWFSANAFGGANYLNTPIGAASHAEEPGGSVTAPVPYFTLWLAGRNFAICAWGASFSTVFQAVGDPLIKR